MVIKSFFNDTGMYTIKNNIVHVWLEPPGDLTANTCKLTRRFGIGSFIPRVFAFLFRGRVAVLFFFLHLFLLVGGQPFYHIVVVFAIHWRESATDIFLKLTEMWNASRICVSSLHRGHANLLCIVPILVYVLPKRARGCSCSEPIFIFGVSV